MKPFSIKHALVVSALAGGLVFATSAGAVVTQTITASITALAALNVTKTRDMDFGTWFITSPDNSNTVTLTKDTTGDVTVSGSTGTGAATEVLAAAQPAELSVDIPSGTNALDGTVVHVMYDNLVDFADASLDLTNITYRTATETGENAMTISTPYDVTITDGTAAEAVFFGASITAKDPVPAGANTATFDVTFSY